MRLANAHADLFVPDDVRLDEAMARTTHPGIGAHQDDLEYMAFRGILACFHSDELWFGGVTCTHGGGSARIDPYAACTDAEMMAVRGLPAFAPRGLAAARAAFAGAVPCILRQARRWRLSSSRYDDTHARREPVLPSTLFRRFPQFHRRQEWARL